MGNGSLNYTSYQMLLLEWDTSWETIRIILFNGEHLHQRVPMGNDYPSREEILQYIRDGWHFRIKTSKGRRYITRRKGQLERSLGPFNTEVWELKNRLLGESKLEKTEAFTPVKSYKKISFDDEHQIILRDIAFYRGVKMMLTCIHRDKEGFCNYWKWDREPKFFKMLIKRYGKKSVKRKKVVVSEKTVNKWVLNTFPWYCSGCSAYSPSP